MAAVYNEEDGNTTPVVVPLELAYLGKIEPLADSRINLSDEQLSWR